MNNELISKYLNKKEKDLFQYAKELEWIIKIDNNRLWQQKEAFNVFIKGVIEKYIEKYYFDNNLNRYNPIEYANDNINSIILSIIEYCKSTHQTKVFLQNRNEVFLMAVVLCSASYIDISANIIDGDYKETKEKFKYLLQYLEKIKILKIDVKNKASLNRLFQKLKKNINSEEQFFKLFVNDDYYNDYIFYGKSQDANYYFVDFKKKILGLENYQDNLISSVNKKYQDEFLKISYELLTIKLLQEYISNNEIKNYLIPVTETIIENPDNFKIFVNKYFQKHIFLLINYQDKVKYYPYLSKINLDVIYNYHKNDIIKEQELEQNITLLVTNKFMENNKDKLILWQNKKIKFIVKNKED